MTPCRRYTDLMKLIRILFVAAAACVVSLSAFAQWQWVDQNGHKVFSDRPPPPDIPEKNILRQGGKTSPPPSDARSGASDAAVTSSPSVAKASGEDKELLAKKRKAEEADAAKRKAEEEKTAQIRRDNCERAQRGKANLDAGMRIFKTNANGEREVLDDAARAAEMQRLLSTIDSDCR